MFNGITDLIYSADQAKTKIKNIEDLVKKFDNVKMKSQLHHAKFLDDLKNIMGIENEQNQNN